MENAKVSIEECKGKRKKSLEEIKAEFADMTIFNKMQEESADAIKLGVELGINPVIWSAIQFKKHYDK